jgi:hypothetical protein
MREMSRAHCDHLWRGIHAGYLAIVLDEIASEGLAGPASDIEHGGAGRQETAKPVKPFCLEQAIPSVKRPGASVPLIQPDDPLSFGRHGVT